MRLLPLLIALGAAPVLGQTNFHTITANGPVSNRVNIVFLSEGYTFAQFAQFLTHATNTATVLLTNQPFAEYRSFFNVYAIAVASVESGSDHPISGIVRNTFFNSTYGGSDYIITIPTNAAGQGKVDALLNAFMPAASLAILLVNDLSPGGSDGAGKTAITSIAPVSLADIPIHESGHVLANLGDEYATLNPGYPDIEEPNTTRETNRVLIKWNAWISTNTPVPTPEAFPYDEVVGLFEGAHYHSSGWYRPKLNCRMGSFGVPFCEVCSEALILSFYGQARPIDFFTPADTNLNTSSSQPLNFAVAILQPTGHGVDIQWLTNGMAVADATNSAYTILPERLSNGANTVTVRVADQTLMVRNDPDNRLGEQVTWNVNVSLSRLELSAPRWLGAGTFAFRVSGVAPQGFYIESSTNFANWTRLVTNDLVNGQFNYTNHSGTELPVQMFRAVTAP